MHMPVDTAVRAVIRSPGMVAPLGVLCLRVGAFTLFVFQLRHCLKVNMRGDEISSFKKRNI